MAHKVIIITDPGLDGAFAVALALLDPQLEVIGIAASAGNISADQASRNVQTLIEQLDPPRWPRLGTALPVQYEIDGVKVHGQNGLGGVEFPCAQLHHAHPGDKLIADLVKQYPKEVTIVVLGPATVLARAIDRDTEVASQVRGVIMVGGTWHEPGDVTAAAEFHFYCDPAAVRQVLRCGAPITLIPLDVSHRLLLSPSDLLQLPKNNTPTSKFLGQIAPQGISGTAGEFGTEGFYIQDVLGIIAASKPDTLTMKKLFADVETRGELTRGMCVIDSRWACPHKPNVDLATALDVAAARQYIAAALQ